MYRPTVDDMTKFASQTLSLKDAGAFDRKFEGRATCGWTGISKARQTVSRKARIRAKKASAQ